MMENQPLILSESSSRRTRVLLRAYDPRTDEAFVLSSWVLSYEHSLVAATLGKAHYRSRWTLVAQQLLARSQTLVAANPTASDVLLGFLTFEPAAVHYCFVKEFARGRGIARQLLEAAGVASPLVVTHRTVELDRVFHDRPKQLRFDLTRIWLPA